MYTYIYIYTFNREINDASENRYIQGLKIEASPSKGYEWQINRYDDSGDYNNHKTIHFEFYFNDQTTPTNQ